MKMENTVMTDRPVGDVVAPPHHSLTFDQLFTKGPTGPPDWRLIQEFLSREGRVAKNTVLTVVHKARNIFVDEPNLLKLSDPLVVVGDIHGQYFDLVKLLDVSWANQSNILFLGDFVDRGAFSIAVMMLLLCMKLNHPDKVFMLRGNHECRQMTSFFNFKEECLHRYDVSVYRAFMDLFDTLPLGATISNKFFCVHGGISPDLRTLNNLDAVRRFQETPRQGMVCDLLWSDPLAEDSPDARQPFIPNEVRGCSYFFSQDAASSFLEKNRLLSIVRAHEAQLEGYKMHKVNHKTGFPTVITIFSAPNYCDCYNNKGAFLKFDNNTLNIQQFNYVTHPYQLPSFTDVFSWSVPFVAIKVDEMIRMILGDPDNSDLALARDIKLPLDVVEFLKPPSKSPSSKRINASQIDSIRTKVIAMSRLLRALDTLRKESSLLTKLKALQPEQKITPGCLFNGPEGLRAEFSKFQKVPQYRKER